MDEIEVIPEVKQIAGALLFASKTPLAAGDIRKVLQQVAEARGGAAKDFAGLTEQEIRESVLQLGRDLEFARAGVHLVEVANGFRLQNDVNCGPWLRHMLERGKANRLSKPALETLAIIAYRQPVMRSEIEAVRGVAVDQVLRTLVDMGLVKIIGRSELPGRPWLLGTTQKFLEYFGLKNVHDLPGIEELKRMEAEKRAAAGSSISEADSSPAAEDEEEPPPHAEPAPQDGDAGGGAGSAEAAEVEAEPDGDTDSEAESEAEAADEAEADEEYDDDEFEDDEDDEDDDEDDEEE